MKLVWSRSGPSQDRPRQVLLLAVVCIFLGSIVGAGGEGPRPLRTAAASLLATGGVFLLAGVAGLALQRGRRNAPRLSLAAPADPPDALNRVTGLQQEEER